MAKPTTNPEIWASNDFYPAGSLKAGQPTKTIDAAILSLYGHFPGKPTPTAANEFNRHYRGVTDLSNWTFEGTSDPELTAHIIETSASGTANIAALDLGDTLGVVTALTVRNNNGGGCVLVEPDDINGIVINPQSISGFSNKEPLRIETNFDGAFAHSMIRCHETAGQNSMGGILCEVATNNNFDASGGPNPKQVAAVNGYNEDGVAGEFRSNSPSTLNASLKAMNLSTQGVSADFGNAEQESLLSNNNGIGCRSRGGPGDDGFGLPGGVGVLGIGGRAGAVTQFAGVGVWAIGGDDPGGSGSNAALIAQSNSVAGSAFAASHLIATATADLATFQTGDNTANGLVVNCPGFGAGATINAEGGVGLVINQTPETGGAISPALSLTPQTQPLGANLTAGDLWSVQDPTHTDIHNLFFCPANTVAGAVERTMTPSFYTRGAMHSSAVISSAGVTVLDAAFSFHPNMRPIDGSAAKVTIFGAMTWSGTNTNPTCIVRVFDDTGAPVLIASQQFKQPASANLEYSVTTSAIHTFATGGARTFRFEIDSSDSTNATFTGYVEIENVKGL